MVAHDFNGTVQPSGALMRAATIGMRLANENYVRRRHQLGWSCRQQMKHGDGVVFRLGMRVLCALQSPPASSTVPRASSGV
jgi:hypothetical protein